MASSVLSLVRKLSNVLYPLLYLDADEESACWWMAGQDIEIPIVKGGYANMRSVVPLNSFPNRSQNMASSPSRMHTMVSLPDQLLPEHVIRAVDALEGTEEGRIAALTYARTVAGHVSLSSNDLDLLVPESMDNPRSSETSDLTDEGECALSVTEDRAGDAINDLRGPMREYAIYHASAILLFEAISPVDRSQAREEAIRRRTASRAQGPGSGFGMMSEGSSSSSEQPQVPALAPLQLATPQPVQLQAAQAAQITLPALSVGQHGGQPQRSPVASRQGPSLNLPTIRK